MDRNGLNTSPKTEENYNGLLRIAKKKTVIMQIHPHQNFQEIPSPSNMLQVTLLSEDPWG